MGRTSDLTGANAFFECASPTENRRTTYLKNFLAIIALVLSLAALQGPLWPPEAVPVCVTARVGGTAIFAYDGEIEKANILQQRTATLSADGPGRLMIHGLAPGKTSLLIRYKRGDSKLYEVVILPS